MIYNSDKSSLFHADEELITDNSFTCESESAHESEFFIHELVSMLIKKLCKQAALTYQLLEVSMKLQFLNHKHEQSASLEIMNSDSTIVFTKHQIIFKSFLHTVLYKIVDYSIYCQFILQIEFTVSVCKLN